MVGHIRSSRVYALVGRGSPPFTASPRPPFDPTMACNARRGRPLFYRPGRAGSGSDERGRMRSTAWRRRKLFRGPHLISSIYPG